MLEKMFLLILVLLVVVHYKGLDQWLEYFGKATTGTITYLQGRES